MAFDKFFPPAAASLTTGSLATMNATTGTPGQSFFNTDYNSMFIWIQDRWWPFGRPEPRYGFMLAAEEFTGQDRIGTLDWSNGNQIAGNLLNPGMYQITNSTASSVVRIGGQLNAIQLGTMDIYMETIIQIPTLSNGSDNACFSWGLNDGSTYSATGACTDGAYFTLDPVGSVWITNTSSNGTLTAKTSSSTPVAGTSYRLTIIALAGTSVTFYVNGTAITAAHTTNIPTGAGRQTGFNYRVDKTLGAGALLLNADAFTCYGFFNGQRVA